MDSYLKRTYRQKEANEDQPATRYPFWDFRSRRGLNISLSSAGESGVSSMNSTNSESDFSDYGQEACAGHDPSGLTLAILEGPDDIGALWNIYEPLFASVDPDLRLLNVAERPVLSDVARKYGTVRNDGYSGTNYGRATLTENRREKLGRIPECVRSTQYTAAHRCFTDGDDNKTTLSSRFALSIVLFLREDTESGGSGSFYSALSYLGRGPWTYHHSDPISNGLVVRYPPNNTDYYSVSDDLPSWSIRQVHCGKEHVRFQLLSTFENWSHNVEFYTLIIGFEPDLKRSDFCLFTLYSQRNYDVQFALKKTTPEQRIQPSQHARLQFRVSDIGQLVPLFPNVCAPISDTRWRTTDHDGNSVVVQTVGNRNYRSTLPSMQETNVNTTSTELLGFYV